MRKVVGPLSQSDSLKWWTKRQLEKEYKHLCEHDVGRVRPDWADAFGNNRSAVMRTGVRTFAFESERARDKFCEHTGARRVP